MASEDCIQQVEHLVRKLREHPEYELEARLCFQMNGRMQSGVSRDMMDRIVSMMQKSHYVTGDDEWKEEEDMFYTYGSRPFRTRVQYDTENMTITTHTVEKRLVQDSDFITDSLHDDLPIVIRVSLKSENVVHNVPVAANPSFVRIKQRRRFVTQNKAWAFDLSMTWSGKTRSDAETSQMSDEPTYEIECELINPTDLLRNKSDKHIAASILLKMLDFMPSDTRMTPKVASEESLQGSTCRT